MRQQQAKAGAKCFVCQQKGQYARDCPLVNAAQGMRASSASKSTHKSSSSTRTAPATVHEVDSIKVPFSECHGLEEEHEEQEEQERPSWWHELHCLQPSSLAHDRSHFAIDRASPYHAMPIAILRQLHISCEPSIDVGACAAGGHRLRYFGKVQLTLQFEKKVTLVMEVMSVIRPLLSVGKLVILAERDHSLCLARCRGLGVAPRRELTQQLMPVEVEGPAESSDLQGEPLEAEQGAQVKQVVPRVAPLPQPPSLEVQRLHMYTHLPMEPRCWKCVASRARDDPHFSRSVAERRTTDEGDWIVMELDYTFVDQLKILSVYMVSAHTGAGTAVELKGIWEFALLLASAENVDLRLNEGDYSR